jgi:hypothetical protein
MLRFRSKTHLRGWVGSPNVNAVIEFCADAVFNNGTGLFDNPFEFLIKFKNLVFFEFNDTIRPPFCTSPAGSDTGTLRR